LTDGQPNNTNVIQQDIHLLLKETLKKTGQRHREKLDLLKKLMVSKYLSITDKVYGLKQL
jgi:hypothetical protein